MKTINTNIYGAINLLGLATRLRGNEITIMELAERIISLVGSRPKLEFWPLPQDDPPHQRCPDITRAMEILHWSPKVLLDQDLQRTIADFDDLLSTATRL